MLKNIIRLTVIGLLGGPMWIFLGFIPWLVFFVLYGLMTFGAFDKLIDFYTSHTIY